MKLEKRKIILPQLKIKKRIKNTEIKIRIDEFGSLWYNYYWIFIEI